MAENGSSSETVSVTFNDTIKGSLLVRKQQNTTVCLRALIKLPNAQDSTSTNGHLIFIIYLPSSKFTIFPSSLYIPRMMLSRLLIPAVCRTRVTYQPSKWPSSLRVSRSSVGYSAQPVSGRPWVRFPSGSQLFLCPTLVTNGHFIFKFHLFVNVKTFFFLQDSYGESFEVSFLYMFVFLKKKV